MTEPLDYGKFVALAERLLERFGFATTIRRPVTTGPAHNPVPGDPIEKPARVAVTSFKARDIDGTRIRQTDKRLLVSPAGLDLVPAPTDSVLVDGVWLKIVDVQTIRPAAVTCLYILQARR